MKIVYIDTNTLGHHLFYIGALSEIEGNEVVAVLPEKTDYLQCKQYKYETEDRKNGRRSFSQYRKWIKELYGIVKAENPDIVHILNGDFFYKYFGFGLRKFKKYKTVITFHCLRDGFLNKLSVKSIASCVNAVVLHSEYLKDKLSAYGKTNGVHIEYPNLTTKTCDRNKARTYFDLKDNIPVLACIGETRYDKGADILLEALNNVTESFQLLIAGRPVHFDEKYIREKTQKYSESVHTALKFLSDDELMYALNAADIIVLPYRKVFDAASGPLGEGVVLEKCILGPNHGNLNDTITMNHLGYTFESENSDSLSEVINEVLKKDFVIDDNYKNYKDSLNVESFLKNYKNLYNNL
ncbi:MAG: glycosyltransferase [Clostridia bacterium]|nr:glycosyltransferase [Clostridia bacterium]